MITDWERRPENAAFVTVWPAERHRESLTDSTIRHLVIECDGDPVAYVILAGVTGSGPVIEFRRIVVASKGRGIGQATVGVVLDHAFGELNAREVWLDFVEHNARAAHIYGKQGFVVDPEADVWAEIGGRRERLVKMTMSRDRWADR